MTCLNEPETPADRIARMEREAADVRQVLTDIGMSPHPDESSAAVVRRLAKRAVSDHEDALAERDVARVEGEELRGALRALASWKNSPVVQSAFASAALHGSPCTREECAHADVIWSTARSLLSRPAGVASAHARMALAALDTVLCGDEARDARGHGVAPALQMRAAEAYRAYLSARAAYEAAVREADDKEETKP